jgi:hypothetical protein
VVQRLIDPARGDRQSARQIRNWWTRLAWPATTEQYRTVAGMIVTALRDGYGIPSRWTNDGYVSGHQHVGG